MFYHLNSKFTINIYNPSYCCFLPIGVTVVFAQFPVNQFHCIGWFNAVMGMTVIFIQILMFKGEMKWTRQSKDGTCSTCKIVKISFVKNDFASKVLSPAVSSTISKLAYICFNFWLLNMCAKSRENSPTFLFLPIYYKNPLLLV